MYDYFEINETKYKKVALIHKLVNILYSKKIKEIYQVILKTFELN